MKSSERKWACRIEDILDAIAKIQHYTADMSEAGFVVDDLVVDAVIRNFQVMGEAARNIPQDAKSRHPEVPWGKMTGMRNVIVHGYDLIHLDIVWRTIHEDLPQLIEQLQTVLMNARAEEAGGA